MDQTRLRSWATHEACTRVAAVAVGALERHGVRSMPVKGLLLARQVYDPAERPITDVDLVVSPADFPRAVRVARDERWPLVWDARVLASVNFVIDGYAVDVKGTFGPAGVSATGVPEVLSRAVRTEHALGFAHWQIDPHDHALLLAMDAFKDRLGSGKPWAREDLVRIAARDAFSPDTLVVRASNARLRTMLAIVADWVLAGSASNAWSRVSARLDVLGPRPAYRARYRRLLAEETTSKWKKWRLSAMTRMVSDSPPRRGAAIALGALGTAVYLARHGGLDVDVWRARRRDP